MALACLTVSLTLASCSASAPRSGAGGRTAADARQAFAGGGFKISSNSVSDAVVSTAVPGGRRLGAAQLQALRFLCDRRSNRPGHFHSGIGHDVFGPVKELPLSPSEQHALAAQWAAAVAASRQLGTPQQAKRAGYVPASAFIAGVGTHWINWSLVGRPFEPARPSMLLFDGVPGRPVRLVGFSYWVGDKHEPTGFAGPNDHWHRHSGLCFDKDGWLAAQDVPSATKCDGYWLNRPNLWMLHAWVVPDFPNDWGRFAPTNFFLCPPPTRTPDIATCPAT